MSRIPGPPSGRDCVFCHVVQGRIPSTVIHEDDRTLAFLDIAPATDGHTLVVPKNHAADLLAAAPEDLAAVTQAVQLVARLLDDRLDPDGLTVFQANREAGWQDVFHLHFHVVPRWAKDSLRRPWRSQPATREQVASVSARLRLLSEAPPCGSAGGSGRPTPGS